MKRCTGISIPIKGSKRPKFAFYILSRVLTRRNVKRLTTPFLSGNKGHMNANSVNISQLGSFDIDVNILIKII